MDRISPAEESEYLGTLLEAADPCPKCGGNDLLWDKTYRPHHEWVLACQAVGCSIMMPGDDPEDIIADWNDRPRAHPGQKDLARRFYEILQVVEKQAEDEGLWCHAEHISEAYLQQELRRLHAAIEGEPWPPKPAIAELDKIF